LPRYCPVFWSISIGGTALVTVTINREISIAIILILFFQKNKKEKYLITCDHKSTMFIGKILCPHTIVIIYYVNNSHLFFAI